ncbi:hypothetical protein D3C78_1687810 [compost metagenome]
MRGFLAGRFDHFTEPAVHSISYSFVSMAKESASMCQITDLTGCLGANISKLKLLNFLR